MVYAFHVQDVERGRDGLGPALLAGMRHQVQILGCRPGVDVRE